MKLEPIEATPADYVRDVIEAALSGRGYKIVQEFGFSFEDFVAKYAVQMPVAYVSYSGFGTVEKRERGSDDAEQFTVYLRAASYAELYDDVKRIRKYVAERPTFFENTYDERRNENFRNQWFADVVAGTPTLFTKGFDSFELTFSITN